MDVAEPLTPRRSTVSHVLAAVGTAVPLLTIYIWLAVLYGWESWGNRTPWLISDEFEHAQLSRAVARTGHEALRGVPHPFDTLYVYVIAPVWWIHDTSDAYSVAKAIGVVSMTSVVFPTYLLARMLVSKRWALFAASGAAMIPALAYSSMLLVEPLAYPWAALCFFLLAKALVTRHPGWIAAAAVACLIAPRVRGQLAIIAVGAVGAALAFWFLGDGGQVLRRNWTRWDWIGFVVLSLGTASVLSTIAAHHSAVWQVSTQHQLVRMVTYGVRSAGALTIGLGVLPTIAGLSALVSRRGEPLSRERRAFVSVALAMFVAFSVYAAAKSAYVWTLGLAYFTERNLIYVTPLLFVGMALVFERRRALKAAVVAATAFTLYLVTTTPYEMHINVFFDAPGLAVLEELARSTGLTPQGAKVLLVLLCVAAGVILAFVPRLGSRQASFVVSLAAVFVLAWNAFGEIAFARASHDAANEALATVPRPLDWLDRSVPDGAQVYYIGQSLRDVNSVLQLEFWNRSFQHVWTTDGTILGSAQPLVPDVLSRNGRLRLGDEDVRYVVADHGIVPVGRMLATKTYAEGTLSRWKLYRITPPLRVRQTVEGIYGDDWGRAHTALNQYSLAHDVPSSITVRVTRSRGGSPLPADVEVRVGELALAPGYVHGQLVTRPLMGKVLFTKRLHVQRNLDHVFEFKAPNAPFRVETSVTPLPAPPPGFTLPAEDLRALGAQIYYRVRPLAGGD